MSIEWLDLWQHFSAHGPTVEERAAFEAAAEPTPEAPVTVERRPRRPGRPGWTAELFWARYHDACERADLPLTYRSVAQHFVALDGAQGTSPEYLRKLVRRFGRPPT